MKKLNIYLLLLITIGFVSLNSCKKKPKIAQFLEQNCFKAKQVRENGVIVYTSGGASNTNPNYSKFKIILNLPSKGVEINENDGTITKGVWAFNDPIISVSGLNPALTDAATGTTTRTTAEYKVSGYNAKTKEVTFTALTTNLKIGNVTVDYTLVPCE